MRRLFSCETTIAACLLATAAPAMAEVAPSGVNPAAGEGANDIVVTANRREESLQKVPGAITAISQKQLEARGADDFSGFARSVPGLTMNQANKNRAIFDIRGISTTTGNGNVQDPVSVYINDAPVTDNYSASVTPDLRLFDVARVEVLRGPQGTLFGSGSLGGVVRVITNQPDTHRFEMAGKVDLGTTQGGAFRQRYDAMINAPLVDDKLALRVVGYYRNEEGWVKNLTLGIKNDTKDWGARAALLFTPTDNLKVKLEAFKQKSDPKDGDSWNPKFGQFAKRSAISEGVPLDIVNANLLAEYEFENFATLSYSSTYQTTKSKYLSNLGPILGAGTPDFLLQSQPRNTRFYIQELRLVSNARSRLQWVAGLFYLDRQLSSPSYVLTAPGLNAFYGGRPGSDLYFKTSTFSKGIELAGYADGSYEVIDGLKLRGGVRVFHTTSQYDQGITTALSFATLTYGVTPGISNKSRNNGVTWRGGLSYEPAKNILLYGTVSKGFRVGQVNANRGPSLINPADYVIPEGYSPDTTINYEVGAKTSFLDGRVTLNLTGFYIDWKNIQINGTRVSDRATFIANAGKAIVKGVEFEMTAQPARGFNLYATATIQDGKVESLPTNIIVPAAVGDVLPGLAKWKLSGGAEYRWKVGETNHMYVRTDAQFTDESPNAFANGGKNTLYLIDAAYATIDGSIGLDTKWGNVAIYGENLTNNDSLILKNLGVLNGYTTLRPRTFGIRVTYRR
jgi:iron complex outermembrane receptor protein